MKRVVLWGVLMFAAMLGVAFWFEDDRIAMLEAERTSTEEPSFSPRPSKWNEPIVTRGSRRLSGVVTRDGSPISGAVVTALEAHGDHVLSDLPCQCDNHCGQKLLQCGCAEASGQLVELVGARNGEAVPLGRATSAGDGTFVIEGLDDSKLTLWADAAGGIAWKTDVASDASEVKLELLKGRTIKGKVTTTDGSPASNALVTAIFSEQSRFFDVTTNADGTFEVGPVPSGEYAVVAMQNGLLPDHRQVQGDDEEDLALELSVPRALSGVVMKSGAPVPGATVKLDGMHRKRTVTADSKGAFRIERLRPGGYDVSATGGTALGVTKTQVNKREDRADVVIEIEDGVPLDGVIVDERGAPVSGVKVQVEAANDWLRTETNDEGRFHFDVVSVGEHELWASKTGFLTLERQKVTAGAGELQLTLSRATMITGTVRTETGELVTAFNVSARLADAGVEETYENYRRRQPGTYASTKSTDGGFALEVLAAEYTVVVSPRDFGDVTMQVTAPRDGLDVVVKRGATIRGRVFDADGKPAARVYVSGAFDAHSKTAQTDADGTFTLGGLAAGHWELNAISYRAGATLQLTRGVELAANAVVEVELRPEPGALLRGVLIDERGQPAPKVMLSAMSTGGSKTSLPRFEVATTDADGAFLFRSLPAGPVTLSEENGRGRLEVVAPDEHIIFKLKRGTSVSGVVVNENGKPVTEFRIRGELVDSDDGRFSVPARKGKNEFAVDAEGYAQLPFEVDVKDGENDVGTLRLSRGEVMTGVVRDAQTHAPIAGALVDIGASDVNRDGFSLSERDGAVKTNAEGRYKLRVAPEATWMMVKHPDYEPKMQRRGGSTSNVDIELDRGGVVLLTLLDDKDAPVKEAFVMAASGNKQGYFEPRNDGRFEAKGLAAGEWTITVMTRHRALFRAQAVTVSATPASVTMRAEKPSIEVTTKGSEHALLINANIQDVSSYRNFGTRATNVPLKKGGTVSVFPGVWTVVMTRDDEVAFQPLGELKTAVTVELKPQWQPMQR